MIEIKIWYFINPASFYAELILVICTLISSNLQEMLQCPIVTKMGSGISYVSTIFVIILNEFSTIPVISKDNLSFSLLVNTLFNVVYILIMYKISFYENSN